MKLQILIPQYKETDNIIKPLLDSIAFQQTIDFSNIGVIICNDGSDVKLSTELLDSYPFDLQYHICEHGGVSATRDNAFNLATADYVMWCDADDMFYDMLAMYNILQQIDEGFDVFFSKFLEQLPDGFDYRENDKVFVHGKIFNRKYLLDNNIRWNKDLTIHEDHYFVELAMGCTSKVKYSYDSFYLWSCRPDSICRKDGEMYIIKTYTDLIKSTSALVNEFMARNNVVRAQRAFVQMCYDTYYELMLDKWDKYPEYKRATELYFKEKFLENEHLFKTMPLNQRCELAQGVRNRVFNEGFVDDKITFMDWLKYIKELR